MLSNIVHTVCPLESIKELSGNLKKAIAGEAAASKACFDVFEALTNDKSMGQILRGSKDEFEYVKDVAKTCLDLFAEKELKTLRQESEPDDSDIQQLRKYAVAFTKCYFRQQGTAFADLLFEIKETEVPPKKEPKEGEEPEEEDDETKEKRKKNEALTAQLEVLKPQLFNSFINLTEKYSEVIDAFTESLKAIETD